MRIELFDMNEFISINKLEEVTSPILFERGGTPNPDGLLSNRIFGVSTKSRKETFAYIDLHGYFFTPHIYKIIKRVYRNIDKVINGEMFVSIDKTGKLVKDDAGETGIEFIYENWEKIKWEGNGGMSSERTNLISKSKKSEVFLNKYIVCPVFYRDISSSAGGGGDTTALNNYYVRLIRMAAYINDRDMFDISFHSTNYSIQNTLVEIYNYMKDKLDKKNGLLRRYLMGKNTDYSTRTVISEPIYDQNNQEDNIVDFTHSAISIASACVMCYPFVVSWLRNFFERELIENKTIKWKSSLDDSDANAYVSLKNPESYFSEKYIKTAIDKFKNDPSSRYDKILVPTTDNKPNYLVFNGRLVNESAESSALVNRYMTWTDLLFIACSEITADKHVMVTRYPLLDVNGIFISRIRISSTLRTTPMMVNNTLYKWYPVIDLNMTKEQVSNNFIDTTKFSNSYLKGLDGDYDGDQVTAKILWTQEANDECERVIMSKSFILGQNGKSVRGIDLEAVQTFYTLTKNP